MSCEVEIIADCGDLSCIARSLFITNTDSNWFTQCVVSLSSCGNILAVGHKNRLCILLAQWISSSQRHTFIISWSGTVDYEVTAILVVPICLTKNTSQDFSDWFCVITGFTNGSLSFYTHSGHLLLNERFDEKPVMKISCHTGTYGTLPDDICVLYQSSECIISGVSLFKTLRYAKAQFAKVEAGVLQKYCVNGKNINVNRWTFSEEEVVNDATVAGLELKNIYDHLLSASTYGGYDTWYRSIPPQNTLILRAGVKPYLGFHYALEGGTAPPLQDVAKAVANKIKSALPGWLGGGSTEAPPKTEPNTKSEALSMRSGLYDIQRHGTLAALSPDRRLAAVADNLGRVAVLDVARGHVFRLFKGYRDVQCAFVQVFELDNEKPQLSVIKNIRRALFLVLYNPRKGLIEIRLMNKGNRVAVFTATKNGKLIYHTSGIVGTEQGYSSRRLNLPIHQCVLIDPDGKVKKFNIPFFYALEGEHSDRSKDMHILRELRDFIKRSNCRDDEFENEIISRASELQTIDLKKHCLEMLIRNYGISPKVATACLNIFCSNTCDDDTDAQILKCKNYFVNLTLTTSFYRQLNGDNVQDMDSLLTKLNIVEAMEELDKEDWSVPDELSLLKCDSDVLERLLELAQEKDYKESYHTRVKFADSDSSSYKLFVNAFHLEADPGEGLQLKQDLPVEKYNELAADTFNSLFKINEFVKISECVRACRVCPMELVKLIISHVANMTLESLSMDLIRRLLQVLYSVCVVTTEATVVKYSVQSEWWADVRAELPYMPCPLRTLLVAMACRALVRHFERRTLGNVDTTWVSVTQENAQWSILIGKLEDIAILSIVLYYKDTYNGDALPKLPAAGLDFNLGYIYVKGKGSVSELVARWLCTMGVPPEAVIVSDLLTRTESAATESDDSSETVFLENHKDCIDKNPRIFKWLSLLKKQFPHSTSADNVIANMAWEYAVAWKDDVKNIDVLNAVVRNIKSIKDDHLALGICIMIWSFSVRYVFEATCRLVSKVGKCPKERLCMQDTGLSERQMFRFLETVLTYLEHFKCRAMSINTSEKTKFLYEKIWDENLPCFIDVAQNTKHFNADLLEINYEISLSILFQCQFNLKVSKHLSSLYDIDSQQVFEEMTTEPPQAADTDLHALEGRLRPARMKFLNKVIMCSVELITCEEDEQHVYSKFRTDEAVLWIDRVFVLGALWNIDADFLRRQHVIGLYRAGYDSLAEGAARLVLEPSLLLPALLAVAARRLKRHLEASANPADWIASVPPALVHHLDTIESDSSVATHNSVESTAAVIQNVLCRIENSDASPVHASSVRLAECLLKGCQIIIQENL